MISLSLDSGSLDSNVVAVASGFPPNEYATLYWQNRAPYLMGTPGPYIDRWGHFEMDTQDHGLRSGVTFFITNLSSFPLGDDQFCADTGSQQAFAAKACAEYKVAGATATPSAAPSQPVGSQTPSSAPTRPGPIPPLASMSATPVAAVVAPLRALQVGIGALGVILIAISAALFLRRRRRS
jgi:hypothetical protein